MPFKIKAAPETIRISEIIEFTITTPLPVNNLLNLFATDILTKSVIKYETSTIEKKRANVAKDFPLAGEETIVTPPQKINTPTLRMFIAKPLAASPK